MTAQPLRSRNWFGRLDLDGFAHRLWTKSEGFSDAVFDGRPVIGIANSWSELTTCNAHLRQLAEAAKHGVWSAGGFPLEFPTISLGEVLMKPTAMLFRNLMAMDVEECIRAYPLDAVVLLSGCDKTTPAMLMGAASADVPAVMITGGPMLKGKSSGGGVAYSGAGPGSLLRIAGRNNPLGTDARHESHSGPEGGLAALWGGIGMSPGSSRTCPLMRCNFGHDHPPEVVVAATLNPTQPWGPRPYHCAECPEANKPDRVPGNWVSYTTPADAVRALTGAPPVCGGVGRCSVSTPP